MATTATATLNGGPRGGLHTTTLIHSEESGQDESCRVDSNSSFDSHEDASAMPPLEEMSAWPGYKSSSFYLDSVSQMESSTGKKRRKQSRPVRIPASEGGAQPPPQGPGTQQQLPPARAAHDPPDPHPHTHLEECEGSEEDDVEEKETTTTSSDDVHHHPHHHHRTNIKREFQEAADYSEDYEHEEEEEAGKMSRRQVPLNLSSNKNHGDSYLDGALPELPHSSSSSSHLAQLQLNSLMDNDKTELPGQGTKDSNRNLNPSFSPGLFPLISSNPFFSFFPQQGQPGGLGAGQSLGQQVLAQGQQQQTSGGLHLPPYGGLNTPNPTSGTPSSSSSVGSNLHPPSNNPNTLNNNLAPGALSNIPPQRIFNPEAYCDLCNKEFCNKYFLKTHKANKHGVYSEVPTTSAGLPSQVMTLGMSSSPSAPFMPSLLPNPVPQQSTAPSSASIISQNIKTPEPSLLSKSLALEAKGSNSNGSDRESFCDLCQKKFCNKYFLKRHKAKIHGCPIETNGSRGKSSSRQNFSNGLGDMSLIMGAELESLNAELTKHLEEGVEEGEVGLSDTRERVMERINEVAKAHHQQHQHQQQQLQQQQQQQQEEDDKEDDPLKISSLPLKLPPGLGVSNENTCQFCFREFSNPSLLRAHVTKKHRLLLPTFPPFILPFQGMAGGIFEETAEAGEEGGYFPPDLQKPNTEEIDYECNQCGRSFQTIYLLRMHKSYFHPESDDMSDITAAAVAAVNKMEESSDVESGKNTPVPQREDNNKMKEEEEMEEEQEEADATSDSDDLRRLQTMIMELNRVSSAASWSPPPDAPRSPATGNNSSVCGICSKEFYSSYFLQQHIQHFHASPDIKIETPEGKAAADAAKKLEMSKLPVEFFDKKDLFEGSKKMGELFENSSSPGKESGKNKESDLTSSFLTPGPKSTGKGGGDSSGKRPSPSLSRSYCQICHKELCNKYFMRTHMLKMHGISIESSTGLGGVTCDICNKELCSKYFLKVHKQNTHGIVEDGPSPPNPSTPGPVMPLVSNSPQESPVSQNQAVADLVPLLASNPVEVQNRYFCHYSEVCPFCGRRFRSAKWLKTHLMADHGQEGKDKWKSIEKSLQQSQSRRPQKMGSSSGSSGGRSGGKSKSSKSGLPLTSNGSSGNKCALCGYQTPDVEVMKVHLIKEHANQLGADGNFGKLGSLENLGNLGYQDPSRVVIDPLTLLFQKMEGGTNKLYRCAYCPFTTSLLVYLYAHERTHTGLANSMTAPQTPAGNSGENSFQCPMCFHSFHHLETFQQHLIGHQMSGVLAPFFTPATTASGRLNFENPATTAAADFPAGLLLNGTPEGLLLSLKNADVEAPEESEEKLSPEKSEVKDDADGGAGARKRRKIHTFKCSYCEESFKSRGDCSAHIHLSHGRRGRNLFRCRKCKFHTNLYPKLLVHNRVHHSIFRGQQGGRMLSGSGESRRFGDLDLAGKRKDWSSDLPQGRAIPQQGFGDYLMQGFLLSTSDEERKERVAVGGVSDRGEVTSSEEREVVEETLSHNNNHNCANNKFQSGFFVPSLVYLPVREKVSQSVRVSFSLTPTS